MHGNAGRRPANAIDPSHAARIVAFAKDGYAGLNNAHLGELLAERKGLRVSRASIQRSLLGAWTRLAFVDTLMLRAEGSREERSRATNWSPVPGGVPGQRRLSVALVLQVAVVTSRASSASRPNALRQLAKRVDLDAGVRSEGLTSDERTELARLRRQVRVLTEEREILAKATALFVGETGRTR